MLWPTIDITEGTPYLVTDSHNLSSDGIIGLYKCCDGVSIGGGTALLIGETTVKNYL